MRNGRQAFLSSSQPLSVERMEISESYTQLSEEPSMSQFTSNPHLPESLVGVTEFSLLIRCRLNGRRGSRTCVLLNG
jgi:hypothetical protein